MNKPKLTNKQLEVLYDWLWDQIEGSKDYFTPEGQKVARIFWFDQSY